MFYRTPPAFSLLFKKVSALHMFFVFFPLAVIVLDKEKRVQNKFVLRPWMVSGYLAHAEHIIETTDLAVLNNITLGDILSFSV